MRAAVVLAAAIAATGVSARSTLMVRQDDLAGCEDLCNPVMDWALTCRSDMNACMQQCNAELLDQSNKCLDCMKQNNPSTAARIEGYVGMVASTCGDEANASGSSSGSATGSASSTGSGSSDAAAAATTSSSGSATGSATGSSTGSATSGSASGSGLSKPSGSSSGSGTASASAPAGSTSGSSAGKIGISLGAAAAGALAFFL